MFGINLKKFRESLHRIIFEAETREGKLFDITLLVAILLSVGVVVLESVSSIKESHGAYLRSLEWFFTLLFTGEYIMRLYCVAKPFRYARSFFGIVDLLAILPTYLSLFIVGSQSLIVIRCLRLLRIFRILKLARHAREAHILMSALRASRPKITVFLGTVVTVVLIFGTLMYIVEGERQGFNNIPKSIYWAVVTTTTVGYGDVVPHTTLGKVIASFMMVLGYAIIAVPTGIVSVELAHASKLGMSTRSCNACGREGHDVDSLFCRFCGQKI